MDLEHPAITQIRNTGYTKENAPTAMDANKNNIQGDYITDKESVQMHDIIIDFIEAHHDLENKLYEYGVIAVSLNSIDPYVQISEVNDFIEAVGDNEISIKGLSNQDGFCSHEAYADFGDYKCMILLDEKERVELEELINE